VISPSLARAIQGQVAIHTRYILDFERSQDYKFVKMLDKRTNSLRLPSDWKRRANDILAAAYLHAIAYDHGSGDDCVDAFGNTYEVKLTYIKSRDLYIGDRGGLLHRGSELAKGKGLMQACAAKFRVYGGTKADHHNQTTAYILMSRDHNCFITGYIMNGNTIEELLMGEGRKSEERAISLSQFQTHGYEFGSMIPHIGWDAYHSSLYKYVMARDGKLPVNEAKAAIKEWITLADPLKLKTL
jgi:hypothetical protein